MVNEEWEMALRVGEHVGSEARRPNPTGQSIFWITDCDSFASRRTCEIGQPGRVIRAAHRKSWEGQRLARARFGVGAVLRRLKSIRKRSRLFILAAISERARVLASDFRRTLQRSRESSHSCSSEVSHSTV